MQADTLILKETNILPWPTYEKFKEAVIATEVNKSEMQRARINIEQLKNTLFTAYLPMDSYSNYKNFASKMWKGACSKGQMTLLFSIGF